MWIPKRLIFERKAEESEDGLENAPDFLHDVLSGQTPVEVAPQSEAQIEPVRKTTRRRFIEILSHTLGLLGATTLADQVTQGGISKLFFRDAEAANAHDTHEPDSARETDSELGSKQLEEELHRAEERVEREFPEHDERAKKLKTIDYLGTALFGVGVASLLLKKHITLFHYGALGTLLGEKYALSNEEERKDLKHEIASNAKACAIIGGTITMAEGVKMDVESTYEDIAKRKPEQRDRVALMTLLSACLSTAITTVGSSSVTSKMAHEIAQGDENIMAA